MSDRELNLDGLIGPTHNYSGLSQGNVASESSKGKHSNPKAAALQGLAKMKRVADLGVPQMVMPPHPRPDTRYMYRLGFSGSIRQQIQAISEKSPELLPMLYSSSGMWTANAATVAPSVDTHDGRVHFTPANLLATVHRSAESKFSSRALKRLFPADAHFVHHDALPANRLLMDEGAANHMRLTPGAGKAVHVFVYGRSGAAMMEQTSQYPARQTLAASQAVARLHTLDESRTFFLQQNPDVIDRGVFHNDVIATSHGNVLLMHETAYIHSEEQLAAMQSKGGGTLNIIKISSETLSVDECVASYLFNSQMLSQGNHMIMLCPVECQQNERVKQCLEAICSDAANPVKAVHYVDLTQSMQNGGGPACLRLRVVLTPQELEHVHTPALLSEALYHELVAWVEKYYRDHLAPEDLHDPLLAEEVLVAYEALEGILQLRGLYHRD